MGDYRNSVIKIVKEVLQKQYPHMQKPSALYAQVTKVSPNRYNLRILDKNREVDRQYPEIPNVKSKQSFVVGETVAVLMINGIDAYIVGGVE